MEFSLTLKQLCYLISLFGVSFSVVLLIGQLQIDSLRNFGLLLIGIGWLFSIALVAQKRGGIDGLGIFYASIIPGSILVIFSFLLFLGSGLRG